MEKIKELNHVDFLYKPKLEYIGRCIDKIENINILEFGVMKGRSTGFFLNLCNRLNGKLFSVDMNDHSKLFSDKRWTFIHSRDDNFELMDKILSPLLEKDERIKILFLSKENKDNNYFRQKYPNRVFIKWLEHKDVLSYLHCCDYGLLLREQSETNKVASPVKFAEYLYAGLPVLITENLGDFSNYVVENDCGFIIKEEQIDWSLLKTTDFKTKEQCFLLAIRDFMKESKINTYSYQKLVDILKTH